MLHSFPSTVFWVFVWRSIAYSISRESCLYFGHQKLRMLLDFDNILIIPPKIHFRFHKQCSYCGEEKRARKYTHTGDKPHSTQGFLRNSRLERHSRFSNLRDTPYSAHFWSTFFEDSIVLKPIPTLPTHLLPNTRQKSTPEQPTGGRHIFDPGRHIFVTFLGDFMQSSCHHAMLIFDSVEKGT